MRTFEDLEISLEIVMIVVGGIEIIEMGVAESISGISMTRTMMMMMMMTI